MAGQPRLGLDGEGGVEVDGTFVGFSLILEEETVEVSFVVGVLRSAMISPVRGPKEQDYHT